MSRPLGAMLVAASAVAFVGCGPAPEPEIEPSVGMTAEQYSNALGPGTTLLTYDITNAVTGSQPTFGTADGGTDRDWIVVAACESANGAHAIAVVNVDDFDAAVAEDAGARAFDRLLVECDD